MTALEKVDDVPRAARAVPWLGIMLWILGSAALLSGGTAPKKSTPVSITKCDSWKLYVTAAEPKPGRRTKAVIIVTLVNSGTREQTAYTPGLVGPILLHVDPKVEPMEAFTPPRKGNRRPNDFVRLRPGEGFSRTDSLNIPLKDVRDVSQIQVRYLVYETGQEGRGGHVSAVLSADAPLVLGASAPQHEPKREGGQ